MKLPSLLKAIKPPLLEQKVIVYTQVMPHEMTAAWVVRTYLAFVDGSEEIYSDFLICDCSSMHKFSGHIKYGVRHNLFSLLAICPEDDDDGNSGAYTVAATPAAQALPGLPGPAPMPAPLPMPGQQAPAPAAMAYPVQPLPVLQ